MPTQVRRTYSSGKASSVMAICTPFKLKNRGKLHHNGWQCEMSKHDNTYNVHDPHATEMVAGLQVEDGAEVWSTSARDINIIADKCKLNMEGDGLFPMLACRGKPKVSI